MVAYAGYSEPEEMMPINGQEQDRFNLSSYPNPFNPTTRIRFTLDEPASVSLKVYDLLGRVQATLMEGAHTAGTFEVLWTVDATLPSGIYVYRLQVGDETLTRQLTLLK